MRSKSSRYLLAAQAQRANAADAAELAEGLDPQRLEKWVAALAAEKQPLEDPLAAVAMLAASREPPLAAEWQKLAEQLCRRRSPARASSTSASSSTLADFRRGDTAGWQVGGQGLRAGRAASGDFVVASRRRARSSRRFCRPAATRTCSRRSSTARSARPSFPPGKKHISFQVLGQRSSAVRLVSNNCQLNYKNYRR